MLRAELGNFRQSGLSKLAIPGIRAANRVAAGTSKRINVLVTAAPPILILHDRRVGAELLSKPIEFVFGPRAERAAHRHIDLRFRRAYVPT